MMNAGHKLLLLFYVTTFLRVQADTGPFYDPDPSDDRIQISYAGFLTTIRLHENNEKNTCIAKTDYNGSYAPNIEGDDSALGLTISKAGDIWCLYVGETLDYDQRGATNIYIFKVGMGTDFYDVELRIVNVDDCSPTISMNTTVCRVEEAYVGRTGCFLIVNDDDGILDGMRYEVLEDDSPQDLFVVTENGRDTCDDTGYCIEIELETTGELNFLDSPVHSLLLRVYDSGNNNGELNYVIQVIAVNKNFPTVTPDAVTVEIEENFNAIIDFSPVQMIIEDYDSGKYGQFTIELESDSPEDCFNTFNVIPTRAYLNASVSLSVQSPTLLDYEDENCRKINFKVVATELYEPSHIGTAQVTINLIDLNDESPVFQNDEYEFNVREREPAGTVVGAVLAIDADEGDVITYSITNSNFLTVDALTGSVTTTTIFDYESITEVTVTVRAQDKATPSHITTTQLTLSIGDVNDERPQLYLESNQATIVENSTNDMDVDPDITATDPDTTADLHFSIDWVNTRATSQGVTVLNSSLFEGCVGLKIVDSSNPANVIVRVFVEDNSKLDWGIFDTLFLRIQVEDMKTEGDYERFNSATLTINIEDVNDKEPIFNEINPIRVRENTDIRTLIGYVSAEDADSPEHSNITYLIKCEEPEDYVTIRAQNGQIYTGDDKIDYENLITPGSLNCVVNATDSVHMTEAALNITVIDLNDNYPYFLSTYDDVSIEEKINVKHVIYNIEAADDDGTAPFNEVYFKCDDNRIFMIDGESGEFYLAEGNGDNLVHVKGQTTSFSVQISIHDDCSEGFCASDSLTALEGPITIKITLKDINDNDPVFPEDNEISKDEEELNEGDVIFTVIATDDDDTVNADLTYTLLSFTRIDSRDETECGENLFNVIDNGDNTATIQAAENITDCWGEYELKIQAMDHGTCDGIDNDLCLAHRNGTGIYTININDINNHQPEFVADNPPKIITVHYEDNGMAGNNLIDENRQEITVQAVDNYDRRENGTEGIEYTLTGDDYTMEIFVLSGENPPKIKLLKGLEEDTRLSMQLNITAFDRKSDEYSKASSVITTILVKRPNMPPVFTTVKTWTTNFTENSTGLTEHQIIEVEAYDVDNESEDIKQDIYYYIMPDGVAETLFQLDALTRKLTLKEELDHEVQREHTIRVAASNLDSQDVDFDAVLEESILYVTIEVNDVKDTQPTFATSLFIGAIVIGSSSSGQTVLTLNATDPDLDDTVSYDIDDVDVSDDSLENIKNRFHVVNDIGDLIQDFNADDSSLKGKFTLTVKATDSVGYYDIAKAEVYMITDDYVLVFTFSNAREIVDGLRSEIEDVFKFVLQKEAKIYRVVTSSVSRAATASTSGEWTDVSAYFVDIQEGTPIPKDEIRNLINTQEIYNNLTGNLLVRHSLHLQQIESPAETDSSNMAGILQTILIAVTVVLGTLVIVLFAAFFIKTRSLNRRLEALSTTKFGSQDSGLNRIGMAVPNTNKNAIEGSNPVWGNEDMTNHNFDTHSISSGDSDLIGVEENPEFRTGNITPDLLPPRRPTGHPMLSANPEFTSATASDEMDIEALGRRQSVNPLAGSNVNYMKHDSDQESEAGSASSSHAPTEHNNNFSFGNRVDSGPSTEL